MRNGRLISPVNVKPFLTLCIALVVSACTPSYFQADADRQAQQIVTDRQRETLGYRPQVEVQNPENPQPFKRAFAKTSMRGRRSTRGRWAPTRR
jgi:hypothetical protein